MHGHVQTSEIWKWPLLWVNVNATGWELLPAGSGITVAHGLTAAGLSELPMGDANIWNVQRQEKKYTQVPRGYASPYWIRPLQSVGWWEENGSSHFMYIGCRMLTHPGHLERYDGDIGDAFWFCSEPFSNTLSTQFDKRSIPAGTAGKDLQSFSDTCLIPVVPFVESIHR